MRARPSRPPAGFRTGRGVGRANPTMLYISVSGTVLLCKLACIPAGGQTRSAIAAYRTCTVPVDRHLPKCEKVTVPEPYERRASRTGLGPCCFIRITSNIQRRCITPGGQPTNSRLLPSRENKLQGLRVTKAKRWHKGNRNSGDATK